MVKEKGKKLYYIPGIISLTILPILFIYFADREISSRAVGVIPIVVADTNLPKKFPDVFKDYQGTFPPKRNYIDIILTGNDKTDKVKLDFARVRIGETLAANDSVNGLHFHFSDSSKYWTFVKAIDILRAEGAKTYMPLDNNLWFYHFPPDTTIEKWICGTTYNTVVYEKETSWWTKTLMRANNYWESSWQLIIGFVAFVAATFILWRQKNGR
jgi:hypothetical protein